MQKQSVFKGLTRPAMLFGVPLAPLLFSSGGILLLAFYSGVLALVLLILPVYFILKFISKKDPFIFRLLFLKMKFFTNPLSKKYHEAKTYSSLAYSKNELSSANPMPKISITALSNEPDFAGLIPFSTLIDKSIVLSKNHLLISTFEISGISFECEDDESLDAKNNVLNMLFKTFSNKPVSFYFHSARFRAKKSLKSNFKNSYLKEIDERYYSGFDDTKLYKNALYLSVIYAPMDRLEKKIFEKNSVENNDILFKNYIKKHKEYLLNIKSTLSSFNLELLSTYEEEGKLFSSQLEFYGFLLGGRWQKVRVLPSQIDQYVNAGANHIYFGNDTGQISYNDEQDKFFRIIEIHDYANETYAGILDTLMYIEGEYTLSQSYEPLASIDAKNALSHQRKQLVASEDEALSQVKQLDTALDELVSGDVGFGKYHFSLCIFGDSFDECRQNTNDAIRRLNEKGFMVSTASVALPAAYFSSLPANFSIRPRIVLLSSHNFSSMISLHNFGSGKESKNCWGEAVCMLKTPNSSAYSLNFHQSRNRKDDFGKLFLGNTLILGQSGSGKTVFMNFTFNQMQKYADLDSFPNGTPEDKRKLISFYLDKDYGAKGNILASGGRYIEIKNGKPTGFNPFWIEPTPESIRHLKMLVSMLVTRKGEKLNANEEHKLDNAIEFIMREFDKTERIHPISLLLENLTEDIYEQNSLKARLREFQRDRQFGWIFDNEADILDFSDDVGIYGIDGTEFLDDPEVSGIISFYILWRVLETSKDGKRFVCDIDEAWKWLENETVADEVKNKFKTIRKQNGIMRLATQSVEDFLRLPIAKAIIEQSATKIFLANPLAKEDDYVNGLNLSKKEYEIIKNFDPARREFMIKRADETLIASLDLSSLGKENLMILSTASAYIDNIDEIFASDKSLDEKTKELKELYKNA